MFLAVCCSPAVFAQDDFADLKDEPTVKDLRLKAAELAAQMQLDAIQAQVAESKLRAATTQAALEASLIEHQATVATKEEAIREALFGATVEPVEGTITTTSKAEAYVLASQQIDRLGREIAAELRLRSPLMKGDRVFLVGGEPEATLGTRISSYKVIMERLGSVIFSVRTQKTEVANFIQASQGRRPSSTLSSGGLGPLSIGPASALSVPSMVQAGCR